MLLEGGAEFAGPENGGPKNKDRSCIFQFLHFQSPPLGAVLQAVIFTDASTA